jgi:cytidylate kinase
MIVTIDGPTASGKSSIARALASRLGLHHLATSLFYRGFARVLREVWQESGLPEHFDALTDDDRALITQLEYRIIDHAGRIFFAGRDITDGLSDNSYAQPASQVSADPRVRDLLLEPQRAVAKNHDIIADGRDCGTVVFPHADVKFYFDASPEVRATRMQQDNDRAVAGLTQEQIVAEIIARDARDMSRAVAPLRVPDNSFVIDSSHLSVDVVLEYCVQIIKRVGCHEEQSKE